MDHREEAEKHAQRVAETDAPGGRSQLLDVRAGGHETVRKIGGDLVLDR